jgi:hypothetical protein
MGLTGQARLGLLVAVVTSAWIGPASARRNSDQPLPMRPLTVSGRIVAFDGRPLLAASVVMTAEHSEVGPSVPLRDVTIRPDGRFMFRNVTPGRYIIRAQAETGRRGASLFGTFSLTVLSGDMADITVTVTPGATAEGRLRFDDVRSAPRPPARSVRVRAVATDGVAFSDALSEVPAPDGRFEFRGIAPGYHVLRVENLPAPWTLGAVYVGDRETTDVPILFDSGQRVRDIRVIVTDASTIVTGVVRGRDGQPEPNALVVVFAADRDLWRPYSRHTRTEQTMKDGRYQVLGLPPGEYWIVVTPDPDAPDSLDASALEHLVSRATHLTLGEGERKTVDLQVQD